MRGLILTGPGVYHNYQYQTDALAEGIAKHLNIRFDVSVAEPLRWKTKDFAQGYDVLLYSICMADNQDEALILNMRRQTETLGTPAMVIHCTMHSFRNTDSWWPLYGLKSKTHEQLGPMLQNQSSNHPILAGIPKDWTVAEDELYINLKFDADTLLSTTGEDNNAHSTTWLKQRGNTLVFGTTLGHSDSTLADPHYQRLLANALLYITGNLQDNGLPSPELEPLANAENIVGQISASEGATFLGKEGKRCALTKMAMAAIPCYLGCALNPFEWGDEAAACKTNCQVNLPGTDELITACAQ